MRMILTGILKEDGHTIVGEGECAADAIRLMNELRPDVLTLDVVMPIVDGLATLEAIQAIMKTHADAKIIMVSAMGQSEIMLECIRAGAREFIVKPFQSEKIKETIQRLIAG